MVNFIEYDEKLIEMRRKNRDDHDDDEIKLEEKKYILLTHTHGHHKFSDKEKLKMANFQVCYLLK